MKKLILFLALSVSGYGVTITVCPSGCTYVSTDLQSAINAAQPGDIVTLDPSVPTTTVAGLRLPSKTNPNNLTILIRSAKIYNLPSGVRVLHSNPNLALVTTTASGNPIMFSDAGASYYRFEGIFFRNIQGNGITNLIQFGQVVNGDTFDNTVATLPHDITFDRDAFGGWVGLPGPFRAIAANTGSLTVTNCEFYEIKAGSTQEEAQDIAGWNSYGPYLFRNNHFEASSMETIFGGAQPNISGIRATDSQYLGNEYYRPWSWRWRGIKEFEGSTGVPPTGAGVCLSDSRGGEWWTDNSSAVGTTNTVFQCDGTGTWQPTTIAAFEAAFPVRTGITFTNVAGAPTGTCPNTSTYYQDTTNNNYYLCSGTAGTWTQITLGKYLESTYQGYFQKNHLELKNSARVKVDGNYLHNAWLPASLNQNGACILINQVDNVNNSVAPKGEPAALITDVEIKNNRCDHTPFGVSVGVIGTFFLPTRDINIHDNLFSDNGSEPESIGDSQVIQLGAVGKFSFSHNTVTTNRTSGTSGFTTDLATSSRFPTLQWITYIGNIVPFNFKGFYDETGGGNLWNALDNNWNMNRSFARNVVVNNSAVSGQPSNNLFHVSDAPRSGQKACPDCANPAPTSFASGVGFVNYAGGDYHLSGSSTYAGTWAEGKPAGADIDQVNWSTAGALSGTWNPFLDFRVKGVAAATTTASMTYSAYDMSACTITVSVNPDLSSPVFTVTSGTGDPDRVQSITGLSAATPYFYSVTCAGFSRSGQFITHN